MTTATYTLKSNGLSETNNTDSVSGQWWSRSPTPVESVGDAYEVMAEIVSDDSDTTTGTFDEWISLSTNRTWSAEASSDTTTVIRISIRDAASKALEASSLVTMTNSSGAGASFVELVTALGPLNWWRLNESSGLVAVDSGSQAANLIYPIDAGTSGYDEPPSSAYTGDGARSKRVDAATEILVSSAGSVGDLTNAMTIEFAFYVTGLDGPGGASEAIMFKGDAAGAGGDWRIDWFYLAPDTPLARLRLRTFGPSSNDFDLFFGDPAGIFTVDEWHYISIRIDNSGGGFVDTRVNGVEITSVSVGTTVFAASPTKVFSLGGQTPAGSGVLASNAIYDEVQIYNKLLTPTERANNYSTWATGSVP